MISFEGKFSNYQKYKSWPNSSWMSFQSQYCQLFPSIAWACTWFMLLSLYIFKWGKRKPPGSYKKYLLWPPAKCQLLLFQKIFLELLYTLCMLNLYRKPNKRVSKVCFNVQEPVHLGIIVCSTLFTFQPIRISLSYNTYILPLKICTFL